VLVQADASRPPQGLPQEGAQGDGAFLNSNQELLKKLGLKKSPGKSTIQRAAVRISNGTLVKVNDRAQLAKISITPMV